MIMHSLLLIAALVVSRSAAAVTVASGQGQTQLKIGVVAPTTGPLAAHGQELLRGIELAQADLQHEDSALAARVIVIHKNPDISLELTREHAQNLVTKEHVGVLIGSVAAAPIDVVIGIGEKYSVPVIVPASSAPGDSEANRVAISCGLSDPRQGEIMARFVATTIKKKTAALLIRSTVPTSVAFARGFQRVFVELGGTISTRRIYDSEKEHADIVREIMQSNADVVVSGTHYGEAAQLMATANKMGLHKPFVGGEAWDTPSLFRVVTGAAAKGHLFATTFSPDDTTPKTKAFVDAYAARHGFLPSALAALGYDAYRIAIAAFKRSPSGTKDSLLRALTSAEPLDGVSGHLAFGLGRETVRSAAIMKTGENQATFQGRVDPLEVPPPLAANAVSPPDGAQPAIAPQPANTPQPPSAHPPATPAPNTPTP